MKLFIILLIPLIFTTFIFYKIQYELYKCDNKIFRHFPTLVIGIYIVMYIWFYLEVYSEVWPGNTYMLLTAGITNALLLLGLLGMIVGKYLARSKFKSKNGVLSLKKEYLIICILFLIISLTGIPYIIRGFRYSPNYGRVIYPLLISGIFFGLYKKKQQ